MPKRKTLEEFLTDAKIVHGNKYDYSQVKEYVNNKTPVAIVCNTCGKSFQQKPHLHLTGHGCPYCANNTQLTTEEFVRRAKAVWGDRYTYEKSVYTTSKAKVVVTCPIHGDFSTTAYDFLQGHGCYACGIESLKQKRRISQDQFIAQCKAIHGNRYDYSQTVYRGKRQKITIICREHGPFEQWPGNHLNGEGCKWCKRDMQKDLFSMGRDEFITKAQSVHGNRYDYSKVVYVNNHTKVCIVCLIHGEFWQFPNNHINQKQGCPECCSNQKTTTEAFIEKSRSVHGDRYDYSKVVYKNNVTPVCIICPEHGEFWQKPMNHLAGCGCPECGLGRSKQETKLYNVLSEQYDCERHYKNDVLGRQHIDIYLKDFNIAVEYQGEQHFRPVEKWGGEKYFLKQVERDKTKNRICEENGILLLYFVPQKYMGFNELYSKNTYSRYDRLLARIKKEVKKRKKF